MFDVCVIGGGPAGSALALRLARLGRSVVVVEKVSFPRRHVGESLTGGAMRLLNVLGVLPEIEQSALVLSPRATILWAGQLRHRNDHDGYQVDRGLFDIVLLSAARTAGASVMQPVRALEINYDQDWSIRLEGGKVLRARFLADAAGRSRILGGGKTIRGQRLIAMYAYWSGVDPGDGETLVEAGLSQWYWGAPLPDGSFNAIAFIGKGDAKKVNYLDLIRTSRLLGPRLERAQCGELRVCDATAFLDKSPVTRCSIKVGDAAITIDPLSSQGVHTALGTALHASVVINTVLDFPERTNIAMGFYRDRVAESAKFHARAACELYREQSEFAPTRFWIERAVNTDPLGRRQLNRLPSLDRHVRVSSRVAFVPLATVTDQYVVEAIGVELFGRIYGRVGNASVPALLKAVKHPIAAKDLVHRWSKEMPVTSALQVLEWAWSEGLVEGAA
jgi:flavin-dependent dehydrogenase